MVAFDEKLLIDLHLIVAVAQRFERRLSEQRLSYPGEELHSLCTVSLQKMSTLHEKEGNQALLRASHPFIHGVKAKLNHPELVENKHVNRLLSHITDLEQRHLWPTSNDHSKMEKVKSMWMEKRGKEMFDTVEWNKFLQKFSQHLHRNAALPRHDQNFLLLNEKRLMENVHSFLR